MGIEEIYPLLTEAIRRAETLEDLQAPGASSAYLDVSLLEERVAEALPPSDPEGALARRGAVRAALAAKEVSRAHQLVERFITEAGVDSALRDDLIRFTEQAESSASARFPRVAASYGISAVRHLARAFIRQGAPFPIG